MLIEHAAFAHGIFSNVPFTLPLRTSTSGCSGPRLHCKACRALRIHRRAYRTRGFHGLMDKPLASLSPLASIALSISFHLYNFSMLSKPKKNSPHEKQCLLWPSCQKQALKSVVCSLNEAASSIVQWKCCKAM